MRRAMAVSFKTLAFGILVIFCECYADLPLSTAHVITGEGLDGAPYLPSLSLLKEENGKLTKTSIASPGSNVIKKEKKVGESVVIEKLKNSNPASHVVSNSTSSNDNIINKNSLPTNPSSQDLQSIPDQSAANTRETNAVKDSVNENKINNPATEINSRLNTEKKAVDKTDVTTTVNSGISGEVIKEGDVKSSVGNKETLIRTNGFSDNGNNSYVEDQGVSPPKEKTSNINSKTTKTTTKPRRPLKPTNRRKSHRKYHPSRDEEEIVTRIIPDDELTPNPIHVRHRFKPSRNHPKTSALLFSSDGLNIHESTNQTTGSTMDNSDVNQLMEDLNLADHNHASKVLSDPHITSDMLHKNGLESKLQSSQESSSEGNTSINPSYKQEHHSSVDVSHSNIDHKSGLNHNNHKSSHYRPEAHSHHAHSQHQYRQTFSPHTLNHIKHTRNHTHSANTTTSTNIIKPENTDETIRNGESTIGSSEVNHLLKDYNLAPSSHNSEVISDPHITRDMLHQRSLLNKDSNTEENHSVNTDSPHSNDEQEIVSNHNIHKSNHYRPESQHYHGQAQHQHRQTFSPHISHHIKHSRNHTHITNTTTSTNIIKPENTDETIPNDETTIGRSEVNHLLKENNLAASRHNSEVISDPHITRDMLHQRSLLNKDSNTEENHSVNIDSPHSNGEQEIVSNHNIHKSSHYRPESHHYHGQAQHQHKHTFSPHISHHRTHTGDINTIGNTSTTSSNLNKQDNTHETSKATPDVLDQNSLLSKSPSTQEGETLIANSKDTTYQIPNSNNEKTETNAELLHSNADSKDESNQNHHKYSHYKPTAHHYNAHSQNQHRHTFSPHTPNHKKHYGNINNNNTSNANASTSNSSSNSSGHHRYTSNHKNLNSHRHIHKNSHDNQSLTSLNVNIGSKLSSNNHENGAAPTEVPKSKHHRYHFNTHPLSFKNKHISSSTLNNSTNTSLTNQKNENNNNVSTVVAHTTGIYERFRNHQRTSSNSNSSVTKNNSNLHKVNQTALPDSHKTQTESSNIENSGEIYSSPTTSVYDRFRHRQHIHKNTTQEPSLHQTKHEGNGNDSTTHRAATNIYERFSKNRPHQTEINSSRTNNADVPATISIYERFRSNRPRMHMKPKPEPQEKHLAHNGTILESSKHQKENNSSKPDNQVDVPAVKSIYERFGKNRPHMHISSQSQTKNIKKVDILDEEKEESNSLQMKNKSSEGAGTLPVINEELNIKQKHIQSHYHPNLYNKNRHTVHLRPNHHENLNHKEEDRNVEKQIEATNVRVETHDSDQGNEDHEGKVLEENISGIHHKNKYHRRLHPKHYYTNPIHTAEETNDDQAKQDASGERYMSPIYNNGHKKRINPDIFAQRPLSQQQDQTQLTNPDDTGERYISPQKYNDQKKYVDPDFSAKNRMSHQQGQDQAKLINPEDSGERYIPPLYNNEDVKTTVPNSSGKRYMLPQSHNEDRMHVNPDSNDSGERYVSPQDNIKRFKPTSSGKLHSHHVVGHKRIPYHRTPHVLPEDDQENEEIAQNTQENGQFFRHRTENLPSSDLETQGFRIDDAGEYVQLLKRKGRDNGSSNRSLNESDALKKDIIADQKDEEQKDTPNLFSTDEEDESLFETYGSVNDHAFFDIGETDQSTERTVEKVTVTLPKSFTDEESNKTQKMPVHNQTSESKDTVYDPEQGGLADPIQLAHMQEYIDQRTDTSEPEPVTVDPDHWYGIGSGSENEENETKINKQAANRGNNKTHESETPTLETRFNFDEDNDKDNKTIVATSKNSTEKTIEGKSNIKINSTKILNNAKSENTTGNEGFKNVKEENKSNETETDKKNKTTMINEKPMNSAPEESLKRKSKGENEKPINSSLEKPKESKNNKKKERNTTSEVFTQKKINDTSVQTASTKGNTTNVETDLKQGDDTVTDSSTEKRKGNDTNTVNISSKKKNNITSAGIASKKGNSEVTNATTVKTNPKNESNTTNVKIASKQGNNITTEENDAKKENHTTTLKTNATKQGINITTVEPAQQNDTPTVATTVKTTASLEITPNTSLTSPTVSSMHTDESKIKSKLNEQLKSPSPTQEPQKDEKTNNNIKNIQVQKAIIKQVPITENNTSKALIENNKDGENQEINTEQHVVVGNKSTTVVLDLDNPEETIMMTKKLSNDSENVTTAEKPAEKPDTTKIIIVDTVKNNSTAINTEKNNENNTEKSKDKVFVGSKSTVIFNTDAGDDADDDASEIETKTEEIKQNNKENVDKDGKAVKVDLNIKTTEKVIDVIGKDSNTQIYKIKRKPLRNKHEGGHRPVIHKFIFGGRSNLTIEVKVKNDSVYVPANVKIGIGSNNLNFNWSSNAQTKYGISLNLTAKNESKYYEIDRIQLSLVKDGNVSVWTKNVTIQPKEDEDADHVLTIAVAEDVLVVFSSAAFLKIHFHQNIEEAEAEAEERDHQHIIFNVEVTVGVLLAALLVIVVVFAIVRDWRMRVIKRNNKVPAIQESRI